MNYQVFARKYRPRTFDDVLGQDHVVRTLRNAIAQNRLAHAYLFVGPRGTGKTSTSRIFAKALNCTGGPKVDFDPDEDVCVEIAEGRSLDVLEIDGASNNGVEQVRDLREKSVYPPVHGKYKIYYIDEVHMLTGAAFNALLKTLEEPPPHLKFIFATTEAHKILPTILSRCQRFDLRKIPAPLIAQHLAHIAKLEKITLDPLAAHAIAVGADGGMRDAQSMLDQLVAFCGSDIREEDVLQIFGFTSHQTVAGLGGAILRGDTADALTRIYEESERGKDLSRLLSDLILHLRNVLVQRVDPEIAMRDLPEELAASLQDQAALVNQDRLMTLIDQFAEVEGQMKWAANKRLYFEVGVIRACQMLGAATLSDVISALSGAFDGQPVPDLPGGATPRAAVPKAARLAPAPVPRAEPAAVAAPRGTAAEAEPTDEAAPAIEVPAERAEEPTVESSDEAPAVESAVAADQAIDEPEDLPPEPAFIQPGPALWQAVQERFSQEFKLFAGMIQATVLESCDERSLNLAAPGQVVSAMERPTTRAALERIAAELSGRKPAVKFTVREDLEPMAPPPRPEPEPAAEAAAAPKSAKRDAAAEKSAAEAESARIDAEFKDDPLIRETLRIFQAQRAARK